MSRCCGIHVDAYACHARAPNTDGLGRGHRKIQYAIRNEWPSVGHPYDHRLASSKVGHLDERVQRQRPMRSCEGILIVDLAIGSTPLVIRRSIPTGKTLLTVDRRMRPDEIRVRRTVRNYARAFRRNGYAGYGAFIRVPVGVCDNARVRWRGL
jgi:hypothetical protein